MIRASYLFASAALLSACGQTVGPHPVGASVVPASISRKAIAAPLTGDRVIGKDARGLTSLFGTADLDVFEADARKLQFGTGSCIMDAYLYPPAKGREPVVTYFEARQLDGRDADKAQCVDALMKRKEAR
jgi:hypothetical protein